MNGNQFVKALPLGEIELHGDDETFQCNARDITKMNIHFIDGMEYKYVDGEFKRVPTEPARYILVVIIGYDFGDHYAHRITFAAPTEAEVETIREQINQIRHIQHSSKPVTIYEKIKSVLKVK